MTNSVPTSIEPNFDAGVAPKAPRKHKRSAAGCMARLAVGIAILVGGTCAANYVYQSRISASIDPESIEAVVITRNQTPETHRQDAQDQSHSDKQPPPDNGKPNDEDSASAGSNKLDGAKSTATDFIKGINSEAIESAEHPLDPLIVVARKALAHVDKTVQDYSATIIKQARVKGRLGPEQYMLVKIRHETKKSENTIPFSVYSKFLKPRSIVGQEAIWVQNRNDEKIIAHPPGFLNVMRVSLDPDSAIAMQGNRYSIRSIGMKNLIVKMIEKGEKDRKFDNCEVRIERNVTVGKSTCSMLEITHPEKRPEFEFYKARIYIDDKRGLPIAYEGFLWPKTKGEKPPLLERYVYTNIKINVGLTDDDFDPDNPDYNYPGKKK